MLLLSLREKSGKSQGILIHIKGMNPLCCEIPITNEVVILL